MPRPRARLRMACELCVGTFGGCMQCRVPTEPQVRSDMEASRCNLTHTSTTVPSKEAVKNGGTPIGDELSS